METDLPVRQRHEIPNEILSISSWDEFDYADAFTLTADGTSRWTAEQWARAAFGDRPSWQAAFIFRVQLKLRLHWRASPDHVSGARIAEKTDEWIRLEASGPILEDQMIFHVNDQEASLAVFMRYLTPKGERTWTRLSPVHRSLAPGLLRDTYEKLRSGKAARR
ncbi:hypothetical protein [Salininema proteolyticum]|uniref:DUF1990 domain-containing protein n=1 Tax=Salininema proteolyticum TaxID=1607685 RepID=A0ABV8U2N2_9ACTN